MSQRLPYGILKRLNEITNISQQRLCDYVAGRVRPRPERAKMLETVTGVGAAVWVFGLPSEIRAKLIEESDHE